MKSLTSAATIKATELATLSGLSPRFIRELASNGIIPKPRNGCYSWPASLQKLVVHYRNSASRSKLNPLDEIRRQILEDKLRLNRGQLLEVASLRVELAKSALVAKSHLRRIPALLAIKAGITQEQEEICLTSIDEILIELNNALTKITSKKTRPPTHT